MAFVAESRRNLQSHVKTCASGEVGPGHYHNEGLLHKLAMDSIYPKKKVPFNSNRARLGGSTLHVGKETVSPGKLYSIS